MRPSSSRLPNSDLAFYGLLVDEQGGPSDVLRRMVDALFTHVDRNCDLAEYRGTGVIEPAKYMWMAHMSSMQTADVAAIQHFSDLLSKVTRDYYDVAGASYTVGTSPTGQEWALLDRQGLLDITIFDIKTTPDDAYSQWNHIIRAFDLRDPLTGSPFPNPIPRNAFPTETEASLHPASDRWTQQALADADSAHAMPSRSAYWR